MELDLARLGDGELRTEREFLEAIPALVEKHGAEAVKNELAKILSHAQVKDCFKTLESRRKLMAWIDCTTTSSGTLLEVALLITDRSLNEIDRGTWVFAASEPDLLGCEADLNSESRASKLTFADASLELVDMLRNHCAKGTCKLAGRRLAAQRELLSRTMPAAMHFLDSADSVDVATEGVRAYASLIDQPLLPPSAVGKPSSATRQPETLLDFEREQRLVGTGLSSRSTRAIDRIESAIIALGSARERFIAPPKAAKYVAASLLCLSGMLMLSVVHLLLAWTDTTPLLLRQVGFGVA